MIKTVSKSMVYSPITCCAATRWASTAHGMRRPQHKKAVGAFRPLERGFIALVDPLNEALRQWISSPSNKRLQRYPLVIADIAQSMCQALEKTSYPNEVVKAAGAALSEAIKTGVTLDVMEPLSGGYDDIGFRFKNTIQQVKFLRA